MLHDRSHTYSNFARNHGSSAFNIGLRVASVVKNDVANQGIMRASTTNIHSSAALSSGTPSGSHRHNRRPLSLTPPHDGP